MRYFPQPGARGDEAKIRVLSLGLLISTVAMSRSLFALALAAPAAALIAPVPASKATVKVQETKAVRLRRWSLLPAWFLTVDLAACLLVDGRVRGQACEGGDVMVAFPLAGPRASVR